MISGGWVYILANRKNGALYTGVTSDIAARMVQHREGKGSAFCREHDLPLRDWMSVVRAQPSAFQ